MSHNNTLHQCVTRALNISVSAVSLSVARILTALQERREERARAAAESEEPFDKQAEEVEKSAWNDFWNDSSPGLLLYACLHGTVDTVKYFVSRLVSPTARYVCLMFVEVSERIRSWCVFVCVCSYVCVCMCV